MKPRSLSARLERLEAQAEPHCMPRFWITPSWCPLTYAEARAGEIFYREPDESEEAFVERVERSTTATVIHGFKPLTSEEWERIAREHYEKTEQDCSKGDIS